MLHGCMQNPDDFAAGTAMNALARTQGVYVLYPGQCAKANPQRCWNWFKHNHQARGSGEPALIAGMTQALMCAHLIDSKRVYVAGLSAGGAMAAILGDTYPDIFAAVGVHSGLAAGTAKDLPSALSAMQGVAVKAPTRASGAKTIVFHGDADSTVHASNGNQVIANCTGGAANVSVRQIKTSGARSSTCSEYRDANGVLIAEQWLVQGTGHAWSGGCVAGTYTDSKGPDASAQMLRFFMQSVL
jgi:poly(hydroxyalkanoate) depolymerase family esterase